MGKRMFQLFILIFTIIIVNATTPNTYAADHLDGEVASADPAADITDVYAWMQDSQKINMVVDLFPLANSSSRFSDSVQYVIRVNSLAQYGGDAKENKIVCTFAVDQSVSCTLNGDPLVTAVDASATTGFTSADGSFKIFTGLRNDPFFFDLNTFKAVRAVVRDAAPSLSFDEAGCPALDDATKSVLVTALTGGGGVPGANNPPQDFFASLNVLAIVIQADKSIFGEGPLYAVSASTHRIS